METPLGEAELYKTRKIHACSTSLPISLEMAVVSVAGDLIASSYGLSLQVGPKGLIHGCKM